MAAAGQNPDAQENMEIDDDFTRRSRQFVTWFANTPGTRLSPKIELADLRHRGAGRGVVATQDIAQDEELFAIPRSLVLMASTSPESESAANSTSNSWLPLILITVQEVLKQDQSKWSPYLQVLPDPPLPSGGSGGSRAAFDSLMFWTNDELAELQASHVRHRIGKDQADAEFRTQAWPHIKGDLESFNLKTVTSEQSTEEQEELAVSLCHYAGSLIMAYAFDIDPESGAEKDGDQDDDDGDNGDNDSLRTDDDEEEPLKGLVPFADMLNADADRNNARLFQEDDEDSNSQYLVMKAIKPIFAGEECFNDYGPLPRSELLRMYGYVTENYGKYDVVEFDLALVERTAFDTSTSTGAEREKQKQAWLRRKAHLDEAGVIDDGYSFPRPENLLLSEVSPSTGSIDDVLGIPRDLHMVLRGLSSALIMPSTSTSAGTGTGTEEEKDLKEASLLATVARRKLSEYATTLQSDISLLSNLDKDNTAPNVVDSTGRRLRMALAVRMGEKEILEQIINNCSHFINMKSASALAAPAPATEKPGQKRKTASHPPSIPKKGKLAK